MRLIWMTQVRWCNKILQEAATALQFSKKINHAGTLLYNLHTCEMTFFIKSSSLKMSLHFYDTRGVR